MARARDIIETAEDNKIAILEQSVAEASALAEAVSNENWVLQENIDQLSMYLDARGWSAIGGGYEDDGPSLSQLHESSKRIRQLVAMNVHVKRGLQLRSAYVWEGGIHYEGIRGKSRGAGVNVQERIDFPINQRNFFSQSAREEREGCLYADSQPFYVGEEGRDGKVIRQVPITEITDSLRNPDQNDEVWAYRRAWITIPVDGSAGEERVEWIFTNRFFDKAKDFITRNGKREAVSKKKRIFGDPVNTFPGWAHGVPDALSAIAWAEQYRQFLLSGKQMSDAMAKLWAQTKHNSQGGAENAALKIGGMARSGGVANVGASNDIQPLATAGQSYDFAKGLPLLAAFAAGVGVSVISLSANPGNAGGSYGASKSLDRPEALVTIARRQYHAALDREVLIWLGAKPETLDVYFDPIDDADAIYREVQAELLKWGSGLFSAEEIKDALVAVSGGKNAKPVPDGVMLPNNSNSLDRADIDADSVTSKRDPAQGASSGGGFTPTQGSGAATVKSGSGDQSADDIRARKD